MQIISWNINSIKKRLGLVLSMIHQKNPDVLLLQETKCIPENFPFFEIEALGYNVKVIGEKSYNGMAILSKYPIEDVNCSLMPKDNQTRYIECSIIFPEHAFKIINVYVPNGGELDSENFQYKLRFLDALCERIELLLQNSDPLVVAGDYNVAINDIDVYSPKHFQESVCFHSSVKEKMHNILNLGMKDSFRLLYLNEQAFSWWDYRNKSWEYNRGMRIDNILVSPLAVDLLSNVTIDKSWRGMPEPSDHVPVLCEFHI